MVLLNKEVALTGVLNQHPPVINSRNMKLSLSPLMLAEFLLVPRQQYNQPPTPSK